MDMKSYMEACTEETTQSVLQAVTSAVQFKDKGDVPWIAALTDQPDILSDNIKEVKNTRVDTIDLAQAQKKDPSIQRVIHLKQSRTTLSPTDRQREPPAVRQLLQEWTKLTVKDNILYRNAGHREQVI